MSTFPAPEGRRSVARGEPLGLLRTELRSPGGAEADPLEGLARLRPSGGWDVALGSQGLAPGYGPPPLRG